MRPTLLSRVVPPDVEVLIVSYDSADELERCLASVDAVAPHMRVAVREHGSSPESLARLDTLAANRAMRVEHDPTNPGFGAGCNALAASSHAEWLLFLNPDTELVRWPWSDASPPRSTLIGPDMPDPREARRHCGRSWRIRDEIARSWFRVPGSQPDARGFVSGAALLVDAASFRRLGGFDDRYFMFYEDIDLCLRANELGIETVIDDRWLVTHTGAHSTGSRFPEAIVWSYESASLFHASRQRPMRAYRAYVVLDSLLRCTAHTLRLDGPRSAAYFMLARRAAKDILRPPERGG